MTNRPTTRPLPTTDAAPTLSADARRACAAFGLVPHSEGGTPNGGTGVPPVLLPSVLHAISKPGIILLTGPSGSGKSRLLQTLTTALPTRLIIRVVPPRSPHRAAFDLVAAHAPPEQTLPALAAAGLAEPALWARPASCLSEGERARLSLAVAIARARHGDLVICDEFASNLDRAAAQSLGATASRWAQRAGVTLLVATAHEDMPRFLDTAHILDARTNTLLPGRPRDPIALRIEPGTLQDLAALAQHHYRAGPPATITRILRAMRAMPDGTDHLAAVLVVSMPVLNAIWRPLAWPGRFNTGDRRANARAINDQLRCISRVIVAPSSRGLGIAASLVRAYIANPETPCTEAVAAMGACCPFFRAAGMTEYNLPRTPHDARLHDALEHAGLTPTDLLTPRQLPPFIQQELQRWSRHAKVRTTPHAHAATRLLTTPRAYAHDTSCGADFQSAIPLPSPSLSRL